ncbi:MAG: glycosyltransferase family 4 protein [Acidimicrobiales bacterium]
MTSGSMDDSDTISTPSASLPDTPPLPETKPVVYLLTHYPRVAGTFLQREILGVEGPEIRVEPVSLNPVAPADVVTPIDEIEHGRTWYVKAQPRAWMVRTLAATVRRHPRAVLGTLGTAIRLGGTDVRRLAFRGLQMVEAMLVYERARQVGARHIHAQFGRVPATVALLAAELGRRSGDPEWGFSYTVHGFHDFVDDQELRLDRKTAEAKFVVGISDFTRSQLMRTSSVEDWDRIHVVRCGIDLDAFTYRDPRPLPARPVIMLVGRLSAEKGVEVLLDALARLTAAGRDLELRIVGDGPDRPGLEKRVSELGLGDRVDFLGELPPAEVSERLADADVFCLPSFAEGLPVAIMEAMARGVPVVATSIAGIPELVVDGVTGALSPAGSVDGLVVALQRLLTDDRTRLGLARRARDRVGAYHDEQVTLPAMRWLLVEATRSSSGAEPAGGTS